MKYSFVPEAGALLLTTNKLYQPDSEPDFGFLIEANRNKYERLQIPEINDGFNEVFWYEGEEITHLKSDEAGIFVDYTGQGDIPLTFVCDVEEEGNYEVKVSICATCDVKDALIFIGRRRLAKKLDLLAGQTFTDTFVTNICPIVARGSALAREDKTLDVTVVGKGLRLISIEYNKVEIPTIYIAGDSTVTDQFADYPYLPGQSYAAWGQMLSAFVGTQAAISNHAHSGLTTESFRSEGHYEIMHDRIKPGDICLFQFGHNDQKLMELKADEGYRDRLVTYINETKEKSVIPVVISPLARNSWKLDGGQIMYSDLLCDYSRECEKIAIEYGATYIDLHGQVMNLIINKGRDEAKPFFFPGDYTHTNDFGAYMAAEIVYKGLVDNKLIKDTGNHDKWEARDPEIKLVIPQEYRDRKPKDAVDVFAEIERPEENLTRVEAMDFIIKACKFFPTNVYNDMFEDVVGHETYAGTVECAYQNGMIPETMTLDGCFHPEKEINLNEYIVSLLSGYSARKTLSSSHPNMIEEAKKLSLISDADDLNKPLTRRQGADIARKLVV